MGLRGALLTCAWTIVIVAEGVPAFAVPWPQQHEPSARSTLAPEDPSRNSAASSANSGHANVRPARSYSSTSIGGLARNLVDDQKTVWTSPRRLRFPDTIWLVPVAGVTAGLFATDRDVSGHLAQDLKTQQHYRKVATAGAAALVGMGGGLALWSTISHSEHQRETGFLAGEAAINSFIAAETLKYSLRRARPYQANGTGHFLDDGTSFPSEHSAAAWSIAGVIAHEYPGPLPKLVAYGLATAVSLSRIQSRDHFPSDVLLGSAMGYFIGQYVYRKRHDPELGGGEWRSIGEVVRDARNAPGYLGSPYVPLDSWVYPALDRLAALGFVDSGFAAMRPWTRHECQRLVAEAADRISESDEQEPNQLLAALEREFRPEAEEASGGLGGTFRIESLYSRTDHISGLPINDGYHFAQTQINDFGRPFGEGWSTVNGFSSFATHGPWVAYVRGEWQTAPSLPAFSLSARETIQKTDFLPILPPGTPQPSVNRLALLDAYVGLTLSNWQFTFGRQSLSWGPGEGGPMMFSNNAAPLDMFRINRVSPMSIPLVSRFLGPLRVEFFLGQLRGQEFINGPDGVAGSFGVAFQHQPMMHGERFSFKPTKNFEFGFSRTALFAGEGVPFTLGTLRRSLLSTSNGAPGTLFDPGDRRSGLDWSYRLPKLRNWLTFYGDAFTDDQFSPIAYMDRSAIRAGLYLSHFPRLPRLDLRAEGVYTDLPIGGNVSHGFFYSNTRYLNGYTSDGDLLGSWIGRQGQGAQAWTNYWFSAKNRLQVNFRHQKVSQQFIPNGGTLTDVGVRGDYWIRDAVGLSASVQYERWLFPVIQPNASRNLGVAFQISFQPQKVFRRSSVNSQYESAAGVQP